MYRIPVLFVAAVIFGLAMNASAGIIGVWQFDEGKGATAADSSGNNNNGTIEGAAWMAGGWDGTGFALDFDGKGGNRVSLGRLDVRGSAITLACWFKADNLDTPGNDPRMISKAVGTDNADHIWMLSSGRSGGVKRLRFRLKTSPGDTTAELMAPAAGTIGVNEWIHAVATWDGSTMRLYKNGEEAGSTGKTGTAVTVNASAGAAIGNQPDTGGDRPFDGLIDAVVIADRAVTPSQVRDLMNGILPEWTKASDPSPADGATGVALPLLQWKAGEKAISHKLYFGTTPELGQADVLAPMLPVTSAMYYHAGLTPGITYYWRVDEVEQNGTVHEGPVWSFTMAPLTAYQPVPADGAQYQSVDVDLSWTPGQGAFKHEVYFSENRDDVANAAEAASKGSVNVTTLELPTLPLETTYYWRVDEIAAMGKQEGAVWSFTTTIPGLGEAKRELWTGITGTSVSALTSDSRYPGAPSDVNEMPNFESPANIADNYGGKLSAWLHVPVAGEYTFWIASDDGGQLFLGPDPDSAEMIASVASWTNAQEWDKFPSQKSEPITLESGRYYLAALWKDGTGGDNCAAAWQGAGITNRELIAGSYLMPFEALWAYGPRPRNNDVNAPQNLELKWTAGIKAATHQIYFSDDPNAVADGTASRGTQALENTTFDPGPLEFGKTYYWRVDEINPAEADSPWVGAVWSFTTADFIVIDNFEDYVDDVEGRIFQTWIDGWGYTEPPPGNPGNGTGSTVGYTDPPFAEPSIVHGGRQSMPLAFDNSVQPYYSETERTLASPQNWTLNGMNTLSLQVRGYPEVNEVTVTETSGRMSLTGAGRDIWNASDEFTYAYKTLNGDGTIVAKVVSNGTGSSRWAKGGVMIRDSLDGESASAQMVLTGGDGNGAAFQNRATTGLDMNANGATSNTTAAAAVAPPYWVKLERFGDSFSGFVSPDGVSWTIVGSAEVSLTAPVYIGLCVTSHAAGEDRTFQFEGIKTTGSVTGTWQGAEIMSPTYNSPQDLYVAVQDSTNKIAVVKDAAAVNSATWTEVKMPLSGFAGVNMTRVKKLFIGVGDRDNPAPDGSGMLFIDDIRVLKD